MPKAIASSGNSEASTKATVAADLPPTYEAAMKELDQIAERLESGEVPLEQLLAGYQRATVLMQFCKERLQSVEEQIKVLDAGVLKSWKPQV
jgi:exodeoxyribonuclease VII small subunit